MKKLHRLTALLVLTLLGGVCLLSGCGREYSKEMLNQKRLGVYLEINQGNREVINNALAVWLGQTLPNTGITAIPANEGKNPNQETCKRLQQTYQLDYLANINILSIKLRNASAKLDVSKGFNLSFASKCELTVSYRVTDLHNGKVVITGQTPGVATQSNDLHLDWKKAIVNLDLDVKDQLIADAIINALENSMLFNKSTKVNTADQLVY